MAHSAQHPRFRAAPNQIGCQLKWNPFDSRLLLIAVVPYSVHTTFSATPNRAAARTSPSPNLLQHGFTADFPFQSIFGTGATAGTAASPFPLRRHGLPLQPFPPPPPPSTRDNSDGRDAIG
jgi:hypothetical protein